jgi:hypothetical protein
MVTNRTTHPVTSAVRRLLRGLELDNAGQARAALALTIAKRIDSAPTESSLAAFAALSKELRASIETLLDPNDSARRSVIDAIFRGEQ